MGPKGETICVSSTVGTKSRLLVTVRERRERRKRRRKGRQEASFLRPTNRSSPEGDARCVGSRTTMEKRIEKSRVMICQPLTVHMTWHAGTATAQSSIQPIHKQEVRRTLKLFVTRYSRETK